MTLIEAQKRLIEIKKDLDKSAGIHNINLGRLAEIEHIIKILETKENIFEKEYIEDISDL